jgi:hypothetical protein
MSYRFVVPLTPARAMSKDVSIVHITILTAVISGPPGRLVDGRRRGAVGSFSLDFVAYQTLLLLVPSFFLVSAKANGRCVGPLRLMLHDGKRVVAIGRIG